MKENNNLDKRSPYSKVLRERKTVVSSIATKNKKDTTGLEQQKKCVFCRTNGSANLKLQRGSWFYVCDYPVCKRKEKVDFEQLPQRQQQQELVPEHTAASNNSPLVYGSFDRRKKWSGSKKVLDDDDWANALFGSGARVVSQSTHVYSKETGWEQRE
jgi:hypothetical protein